MVTCSSTPPCGTCEKEAVTRVFKQGPARVPVITRIVDEGGRAVVGEGVVGLIVAATVILCVILAVANQN